MIAKVAINQRRVLLLDECDLHLLKEHSFSYKRTRGGHGYVKWRAPTGEECYLHRMIMRAAEGQIVDHIDGNTLNCVRSNLRFVSEHQNAWNQAKKTPESTTSRYKGVCIDRKLVGRRKPWQVKIRRADGRRVHVGYFASDVEAAYHYDLASLAEHGEFGRRNFLPLVTADLVPRMTESDHG